MSEEEKEAHKHEEKNPDSDLPIPWHRIQGAIWLLGLAILAWQDWWWPGILVLVAISGLAQGAVQWYYSRKKETQVLTERRSNWLPSVCPNCGGPISVSTVQWTGPDAADCPYCKANLKPPVPS